MRIIGRFIGSFLIAVLLGAAVPVLAGTSFSFLFNRDSVTNDNQLFLNLAVTHSGYERATLEPVLPRISYLQADLPVVLFLAQESSRPVDFIVGLRSQGLAWSVIFTQLRVPVDSLFAGIDQDPGPPYGKAWGYWKKHSREIRLSDSEVSGLVKIQLGSRWTEASPFELASARGRGGKSVVTLVADKQGRHYGGKSEGARGGRKGKGGGHGGHE